MDFYTEISNKVVNFLCKNNQSYENLRIIKKINEKLEKNGDFRCPLKSDSWKSFIKNSEVNTIINESDLPNLVQESKKWVLHLDKVVLIEKTDSVQFYLNRTYAFKTIFDSVLAKGDKFGTLQRSNPKAYTIQSPICSNRNCCLTDYRRKLLCDVTCNLIRCWGNEVSDLDGIMLTFVRDAKVPSKDGAVSVFCANVVDIAGNKIETSNFYSKREIDMRLIAEHKYGVRVTAMPTWRELFVTLGHAAVTIELLQIKPTNTVRINVNNPTDSNNKGSSFVLYNYARIAAILSKFEKLKTELQLTLPSLDEIDFNLLCQEEEWELAYNYVLYYPTVIKNCIYDIDNGNVNPQYLCSFLFELSSKFSVYYRRVRVLTQPRPHLLPTLFARIYLLLCLQTVMNNAFRILNITPITQM